MTERFNVAGALLVKLFGRPAVEDEEYAVRAARVRDIGVRIAVNRSVFFVALTLVASLATAMVYGVGGAHGRRRHPDRRHPARPHGAARPALRPAHRDLQRPGRHHDRARVVRAGLRGARPPAARRRGARRAAGARRARCASRSTTSSFSLPLGRRGLAGLAREHRDRRPTGQRPGAARRVVHRRARAPSSPSSDRAGPARRRSPPSSPGSTTPARAPSGSTASTCAR